MINEQSFEIRCVVVSSSMRFWRSEAEEMTQVPEPPKVWFALRTKESSLVLTAEMREARNCCWPGSGYACRIVTERVSILGVGRPDSASASFELRYQIWYITTRERSVESGG